MTVLPRVSELCLASETRNPTPLTLLETSEYASWKAEQSDTLLNWLVTTGYEGSGFTFLPEAETGVTGALFITDTLDGVFSTADLPDRLPAGDYLLANSLTTEQQHNVAFAWGASTYRFTRYKQETKPRPRLGITEQQVLDKAVTQVAAIRLVRDLINTPAADMMPEHLSEAAMVLAHQFDAEFSEIVDHDLLVQHYPMIHAVGRASVHVPRLLDIRWGNPDDPKITLVGKGVCFDSGGLNIKPGNYMRQMKKDMGGSAHVLGLAYWIMAAGLPLNLRVLIPAVENAVSSNAFRPGDVLDTRKGLTVEIDNTDAEGRLVLCDALAEAVTETPELIMDFATLTGACRVALGTELPGFFSNDKSVARDLEDAGERCGEPVWQLPLHQPYKDFLKSDIADLVNGAPTPYGGAITAALYLERFVDDIPWVHFDIMAWNLRKQPGRPVGGEAMGVRAAFEYLERRFG